jgi:hypothetical protein
MSRPRNVLDGHGPWRTQTRCPYCRQRDAIFFCRMSATEAWYHCNSPRGRHMCGLYFTAASPKPLKRRVA